MNDRLIVREQEPLNLEMPFSSLDGFITPNESFYVRCHFPVPEISANDWRLRIEGDVEAPYELSYDELRAMESRTIAATQIDGVRRGETLDISEFGRLTAALPLATA